MKKLLSIVALLAGFLYAQPAFAHTAMDLPAHPPNDSNGISIFLVFAIIAGLLLFSKLFFAHFRKFAKLAACLAAFALLLHISHAAAPMLCGDADVAKGEYQHMHDCCTSQVFAPSADFSLETLETAAHLKIFTQTFLAFKLQLSYHNKSPPVG